MEGDVDLCMVCKLVEADIDDYGLLVCNPCLKQRPDLVAGLNRAASKDPVERDHE